MYSSVTAYGIGGYDKSKPNNNLIFEQTLAGQDEREAVEHRNVSGEVLTPVELYCSQTNHITFRLTGDTEQRILVTCPLAEKQWTICGTHVIQTQVHGASPATLNAQASAEVVSVIRLVQQMENAGCPVHKEKPVAVKNEIDDAVLSRITPEFIAQLIASAG